MAAKRARGGSDGSRGTAPGVVDDPTASINFVRADSAATARALPVDDVWGEAMERTEQIAGHNGRKGIPSDEAVFLGLQLPALALRHLFHMTVLPVSRVYHIMGEELSCKTAFLDEMMRWNCYHSGMNYYFETENKDSELLRRAILEHNYTFYHHRTRLLEPRSVQDLQEDMTKRFLALEKTVGYDSPRAEKGMAWSAPVLFGVDSFTASETRATREKIEKAGHADKQFAEMANIWATYCRTLPGFLSQKPIILAVTNHCKPRQDPYTGATIYHAPGGKALRFAETFNVRMKKIKIEERMDKGWAIIKLTVGKNSLSPTDRNITANLVWKYSIDEDGQLHQDIFWDWYAASIEMLLEQRKMATTWNQIQEVVDLHPTTGKKAWSKALGHSGSKDAVSYTELGQMLEDRQDLLEGLYPILKIHQTPSFIPGIGYQKQLDWVIQRKRGQAVEPRPDFRPYNATNMALVADVIDELNTRLAEEPPEESEGSDAAGDADEGDLVFDLEEADA